MKKILGIIVSLFFLNLTAADAPDPKHIESLQVKAAQTVANYLKTSEALKKFNQNPKKFIDDTIALPEAIQEMVSSALLQSYEGPLKGNTTKIAQVAFSASGDRLASISLNGIIELWNTQTGSLIRTFPKKSDADSMRSIAYSPKGDLLASAAWNSPTINIWSISTGNLIYTLPRENQEGHPDAIFALAFSPDGNQLASGSDETIKLWNTKEGTLEHTLMHSWDVISLAYSPSGDQLASGSSNGIIKLWRPRTGDLIHAVSVSEQKAKIPHPGVVLALAYSPSDDQLASGSSDGLIDIFDPTEGNIMRTLPLAADKNKVGYLGRVTDLVYRSKGDQLLSASDKGIMSWNRENGNLIEMHKNLKNVTFGPFGDQFVFESADNTLMLLNRHNLNPLIEDLNPLIRMINLAQAVYTYYRLRNKIHPSNETARKYFEVLHNALPQGIKDRLEK